MVNIKVIDSLMGSGKTSWAIQYMNRMTNKNFLYVTPFLNEIERIITNADRRIVQPVHGKSGKMTNLHELLARQEDIAATHELFKHLDDRGIELIRQGSYTLILDEVLEVVRPINIKPDDVKILRESQCIYVDKDAYVTWNETKEDYDSVYNEIKELALNHQLMCLDGKFLVWYYNPEVFKIFDEIYVMTYLFSGSIMQSYFKLFDIQYEVKTITAVGNIYQLKEYERPDTTRFKGLISVYEGVMNHNFYQKETGLSHNWFRCSNEDVKQLKNNLYNFIRNINKAKLQDILWTTFKDYAKKLHGQGFKYKDGENILPEEKTFIPLNTRATNDYSERYVIAYCVNVYVHPTIKKFFYRHGIEMNEDQYALSEMLQFIWRSRIRKGQQVILYIPSERMRKLLYKWLDMDAPAKKTVELA